MPNLSCRQPLYAPINTKRDPFAAFKAILTRSARFFYLQTTATFCLKVNKEPGYPGYFTSFPAAPSPVQSLLAGTWAVPLYA